MHCTSLLRGVIPHFAQAIKDWILMVIIGLVGGVDIILLLLGTSIPQLRLNATLVVDEENPTLVNVSFTSSDSFLPYSRLLYMCPYNYLHACLCAYKDILVCVCQHRRMKDTTLRTLYTSVHLFPPLLGSLSFSATKACFRL